MAENLAFGMSTTLFGNPVSNVNAAPHPVRDSDLLVLRNKRDDGLLEILVYALVFGFSSFVAGAGIWFAITGEGLRAVSIVFACAALAVAHRMFLSALKRYRYYQDGEAKLTLSRDAICDHRTGVNVELEDVASIRFDRRLAKAHEVRADLHLSMIDGSEHVFNLRELDHCSQEIAWRVKNDAGIDEAEGVREPQGIGAIGYLIGAVAVVGIIWQIYLCTESLWAI